MTFDRSALATHEQRFLQLTLEAMREIERLGARPGFSPCFRVWDYSPHREYRSWLIQTPMEGGPDPQGPIVLERTWDVVADRERLARNLRRRPSLQPTLSLREAELPRGEFASLRALASHISFPLLGLREAHVATQPAQYGIEGFRRDAARLHSERVRLEWGGNPPAELRAAVAWAQQVRGMCENRFPDERVSILRAGPSGTCSLCRGPVLADPRGCPRCGARYHAECWAYLGRCAIYGCRGE